MASPEAIVKTVALLTETWPKAHGDLSQEIFSKVLEHVSDQDLEEAVYFFLGSNERFPPTPGQIHVKAQEIERDRYVLDRIKKNGRPTKHDDPANQPRYECLLCKDMGMVHVVSPSLASRWDKWLEQDGEETLKQWWRREYESRNYSPADLMACCSCRGKRATTFRKEMEEFRLKGYREVGSKERKTKIFHPPACGAYHYHARDMPVMEAGDTVADAVERWSTKGVYQ